MATPTNDDRLDIRLNTIVKKKLKRAAALSGARTLSEYVVHVAEQHADEVLTAHSTIKLSDDEFDRFIAACDEAAEPNQTLIDAVRHTRELGIE